MLVKLKQMLENHLRGVLKAFGLKVGNVASGRFEQRVRELVEGEAILEPTVGQILSVRHEIMQRRTLCIGSCWKLSRTIRCAGC